MNHPAQAERYFNKLHHSEVIRDEAIQAVSKNDFDLTDEMIDEVIGLATTEELRLFATALLASKTLDMSSKSFDDLRVRAEAKIADMLEENELKRA